MDLPHRFPAPLLFPAPGDFSHILMISALCLKDVCYILSSIPSSSVLGGCSTYLVSHIAKIIGPRVTVVINLNFFFFKKRKWEHRGVLDQGPLLGV